MGKPARLDKVIGNFFTDECMLIYDYYTLDILEVNEVCLEKYQYSKEEFLGKKITELGEKYRETVADQSSNDSQFLLPAIWKHYRKDGSSFYVQFTFHQMKKDGRTVQLCVLHDISEEIPELNKHLHRLPRIDTLREQLPLATVEWDRGTIIRDWSPKAEEIFGWKFESIIGNSLFKTGVVDKNQKPLIEQKLQEMTAHQTTYFTFNGTVRNAEGSEIHTLWHNSANYDQSGQLVSVLSLIEDITVEKIAEEKLKISEQRFRVLSEASTVGVYLIQNGNLLYVNPMFCSICGYSKDELLSGMDPLQLVNRNDIAKLVSIRKRFLNSEIDSFEIDVRANSKDGSEIYVRIYGSKIELNGRVAVMGVVIDQTQQMEIQYELNHSIQSYKDLFNSIGDAIYIHDENGKFIEVNQTVQEIFGYSREEIIGKDPMFFAAPGKVDEQQTYQYIEDALNGNRQRFEWWAVRKNGEVFPVEVTLTPGKYFGKNAVIAITRDISSIYDQQKDLKHNEELFRQLFLNAPVGIVMLDSHNEVQKVNTSFEEIFGYTGDEIKGLNIDDLIVGDEERESARVLSNSTEAFEVSGVRRTKDRRPVDVLIYGVPVKVDGITIAIYGIYVDITDQKTAETKLKNSLKEKEVLLAEIHHRVKNNLAVITGLLDLQSHSSENKEVQNALKDSQMRINTMALIHEKLYQNETLSNIDFSRYIRELVEVIKKSHQKQSCPIDLRFKLEQIDFTITQAIPCGLLLNEILTNCFKHAFNEMNGKQPAKIEISLNQNQGYCIDLQIKDNGVGLPDEFDALGKTSLGLTLIKTLARQINADMSVNGSNGTSYRFQFELEK